MASAYKTAGQDLASAKARYDREAANDFLTRIQNGFGQTSDLQEAINPMSEGGYLDNYNRDLAALHYVTASASATAGGT